LPIGAAIGGSAIVGVGGAVLSSSAQKKAANKAADTSLQASQENNALYREIYGQNKALLTPYSNMGLAAGNALTDLLLGTNTYNPATATTGSSGAGTGATPALTPEQQWATGAIDAMRPRVTRSSTWNGANAIDDPVARLDYILARSPTSSDQYPLYTSYLGSHPRPAAGTPQTTGQGSAPAPTPVPGTAPGTPPSGALDAFARFRQGTNYQWRLGQGMDALGSQWAANGAFDSGAEKKAALEFGQNFASNELSNYMNLLAGQQAMGLSAAGAVAGVGTTYAGNVAAQNTNAANTVANAALAKGTANSNMWGGIAQGIGSLGGALYQYRGF
jgi:hypothetical protein